MYVGVLEFESYRVIGYKGFEVTAFSRIWFRGYKVLGHRVSR